VRSFQARYRALVVVLMALATTAALLEFFAVNSAGPAALHAARAARRAGDLPAAELHLADAARAGADPRGIELERALLLAQRGRIAAVLPTLTARLADGPDTEELVWEALGRGYLRAYRLREALRCFDNLLRVRPDSLSGWVGRAETKRQWPLLSGWASPPAAQAVPDLLRAVALAPHDPRLRLLLAEGLLTGPSPADAEPHLWTVMALHRGDPVAPTLLARLLRENYRAEEARRLLARVLAEHPRHAPALVEAGMLVEAEGDKAGAATLYAQALAVAPLNRRALYKAGRLKQGISRSANELLESFVAVDEAERQLDDVKLRMVGELVSPDPDSAELRAEAGRLAARLGRVSEARLWHERAVLAASGSVPNLTPHRTAAVK
jgi:tetratricopeptide (TPR) repeat protein